MCFKTSAKIKAKFRDRAAEFEEMKARAKNIEQGLIDLREFVNKAIKDIDDYFNRKESV